METQATPQRTSDRKRPNKTFIQQMAEFRGHMTENERTQLATLEVKNILQKVNNRAMSEKTDTEFSDEQNMVLQILMDRFVKAINQVINK